MLGKRSVWWAGIFACCFLFLGCEKKAALGPADQIYTVRGQITGLPNPPKQALMIQHEAIPNFVASSGKVTGMGSMEMEFPFLAPGVSLGGLMVGDKIEFVMEMRWKPEPRHQIAAIRKLPAETVLEFGPTPGK